MPSENGVFPYAEGRREAGAEMPRRYEREIPPRAGTRQGATAGMTRAQPADGIEQLASSIAGDTEEHDKLPCPDLERRIAHGWQPTVVSHREMIQREYDIARCADRTGSFWDLAVANNMAGQVGNIHGAGRALVDHRPSTHDNELVRQLERLRYFMGDEDDRTP